MTLQDYSKLEINLPKVMLNFTLSVYFYCLAMFNSITFAHYFVDYKIADIFSIEMAAAFLVILLATIFIIKNIYNLYHTIKSALLYIFLASILFVLISSVFSLFLSMVASLSYAVYTLSLLIIYGRRHESFINKYQNMIKHDKYVANFYINFTIFLFYFLFLAMLVFFAFYSNSIDKTDYLTYVFLPILLFIFVLSLYYVFLFNVRYVYILCPLSKYGSIPLIHITSKFNKVNIDNDELQQWFQRNINSYLNNITLDIDDKIIIFGNTDLTFKHPKEQNLACNLEYSLKLIDKLIESTAYLQADITNILCDMKLYMEKINILHEDKYSKYITRINQRYIPYIEYLVKTYLKNIKLEDESVAYIQEKIILSLNSISEVFKLIYESDMEYMKFNIENEIEAMELLIRQKGYVKDENK